LRARTLALAVVSIGALALGAGCGTKADNPQSKESTQQNTGLASLRDDVLASLKKSEETAGKAKSVAIAMEGTSGGQSIKAHGAVAFGDQIMAEIVSEEGTDGPVTVRVLDTVFYVQIPEAERATLGGKSWMKMDLTQFGEESEELVRQFQDMDPTRQLKTLIASGEVKAVGEEKINGVDTVHYTATAPIATYLDQLEPSARAAVEKGFTDQGVSEVTTDLWVDADYQLRRAKSVMGNTDFTVDYTDYGKAVNVEAPPAADTIDFSELMNQLGDLSGMVG